MSDMSDYLEEALLNHTFRGVAFTPPSSIHLALFTVAPTDSGGGTEVTGGGYARQAVTFGAASGGQVANDILVEFTASGADFGTIVAVAAFDASSGGNMLKHKTIPSVTINDGDTLRLAIGDFIVEFD